MAKRTVPGLKESKGMQTDFPVFPEGKYVLEVIKWTEKESKNGTATVHTFQTRCLDALDDGKENQDMIGKPYFHRMIEMHDDHTSYEQWGHIFVDELKSFVDATGMEIKGNSLDFEDFVGKTAIATLRVQKEKDEEGNERNANQLRKWEADET